MRDVIGLAVILGGFATVVVGLPLLASHVRRRGVGGSVLGPFDEIWHPAAHRQRIEIEQQQEQPAPPQSPGDLPFRGRFRLPGR